jgi:phosphatidylethanolamine/phosphatidyl-N-methylethanolamine N-methyltransferase
MIEHLTMLGRFVRSPRTIGAVAPSSRTLARAMVAGLDLAGDARVVELGPGTGVVTRVIGEELGAQARGLAIEIDPGFAKRLRGRFPNVEVVCASAAELPALMEAHGFAHVDHIVSGLPFASLPAEVTTSILDAIQSVLRPGGTFTTFQYVHGYPSPLASAFRRDLSARLGVQPVRRLVWRNFPPAYVLGWCRR